MRSTKLRWKVLAGMLCAAMVFQSVPAEAVASETTEIVQSYDVEEDGTTEELQDGQPETDSALMTGEGTSEYRSGDFEDVPETSAAAETQDTTETPETTETPGVPETPDTTETPAATEDRESADVDMSEPTAEDDETEVSETESDSTEEEGVQEVTLLADERPDYKKLFSVVSEDRYFYYGNVKEIFVTTKGCEIEEGVDIEFYVDSDPENPSQAITYTKQGDYYVLPLPADTPTGIHELTVKLIDRIENSPTNGEELVVREFEFTTEEAGVFTEADKYYISATDDNIEVTIFNPRGSEEIESVQITASNGDIVARFAEESTPTPVPQQEDPRYEGIGDGYLYSDNILYKTTWVLSTEKNAFEIGNYDIRLTLANGSDMLLSNTVEVSSKAVVTKCTLGMDYDNTNNFMYLYIQGAGFNPSQIKFDFEDEATSAILSAERIDYKTVQAGYIVKFRKGEGSWDKVGRKIKVTLSVRPGFGNINFTQTEFEADLESGVYYAEYNKVLGAVEVGVTTDLNNNAVSFKIVDDNGNGIAVTSRTLTESLTYLTPNESLISGSSYYVELKAGGNTYYKKFTVNQGEPSTDHWEAPAVISKNAERHDFYYYSVGAVSNDGLRASIDGYNGEVAVYASEWLREDGAKGSRIQVWIPTLKLAPGSYTVRITSNNVSLGSWPFQVVASDYAQFVLDTYSLSWIDDSTIQAYIKTSNCAETDDFDIKLTGIDDGNPVEISAVVTERYTDSIYMNITGLEKNSAYKDYYVRITHKKYGLPVLMSDLNQKYYDDEDKGERKSIFSNKGLPVISNNRVIGLNIQNMALPAKLTLYATNSTDIITSITIPSTVEGNYYYFTKEFYDSLEKKDRLYDMTISDFGENWGRSYAKINIGYKDETVVNDFDVKITSDTLYIDGAESGRSAIITVSGNTQKPVFEVSDDTIVDLEDYTEPSEGAEEQSPDPNKKLVVAKATGTTVITIIADGVKKSIFITVTRRASGISLNTSDRNMKVGDSFEAEAYILPRSAEDPTQIVKFTSSDNDILYVRQLTNTTAKVTARKVGTAVLRATLEGTTYTVAVNVSITDSLPLYDKKEIKIKEVGTVYYVENVDRSLSDCELPKGWEWDDGALSLTAGGGLEHCWATYTEEGYQPFSARLPVAVIRIAGIDVTGKTLINRGQKEEYRITYEYVGADIDTDKVQKRLELKCIRTSEGNIAELETLDRDRLVIAALEETEGGTASFALTLSIDNGTSEGVDLFTKEFSISVPAIDCVNNLKVVPVKVNGQNFDYKENDDLMEVDVNEVKRVNNKYSVELEAKATKNGVAAKNIEFSWQTSDQAIASVAVNQDGAVILTIKQAGYVEVTAIAEDAGRCAGTLAVNIMDYAPVLETTSVTVNRYSTNGAEMVLQEQNGNEITRVRVIEEDRDSQNFSVSVPVNGISTLMIKENAPVLGIPGKTVSNCKLEARTSKGNYTYNVKITKDITKPTASLKVKTKANLFYTDAEAVYTITSKYDILSVEDITDVEAGEVRFHGFYDRSSNTIRFDTKGTLNSSTLSQFTVSRSPKLNVKLKITFAGYSEPQTMDVKVATENKKPSLGMAAMVVCPGITSGTVTVVDSKTKAVFPLGVDSSTFRVVKPANGLIDAKINRNGSVSIDYFSQKSVSYTAELTDRSWTQAVNAKGKITYVRAPEQMSLALGSKQLTLNMDTNITKNGVNVIPVSVNGCDIDISSVRYDGTAKDKLIDAGYLVCDFSAKNKTISLGLNEGKRGIIKPGSYKLNLYATVAISPEQSFTIKKATLTIKLTEIGTVKAALNSPKGKINLVDRANTSVVYTPKISGIDSAIKSVNVTGDGAEYFTASLNGDGKVEVKARAGKNMSSNMSYDVRIVFMLQNGYQVERSVKIKPTNTYPKIVLAPAKCNLYRTNNNKYTVSMSLNNSNIDLSNIIGMKIDTSTNEKANNFFLVNNISKNGTVSFDLAGDRNRIQKGKYTIKCLVTFRDAAVNAKPATVNMVITVN